MDDSEQRRAIHLTQIRHALRRCGPGCVASHQSAAVMHRLALHRWPAAVHLTRSAGSRRTGPTRIFVAPTSVADRTVIDGIPVTRLERTAVDVARISGFRDGLITADAAVRRGADVHSLQRQLRGMPRWPGVAAARRVVAAVDGRSESALESLLRARFVESRLPMPRLQAWLSLGFRTLGRTDFYWDDFGVVGEADGRVKYAGDALWREKVRQEALEDAGYVVIRWTWARAHVSDAEFAERLWSALRRGNPARVHAARDDALRALKRA